MNHRHGVFNGDGLFAGLLHIQLRTSQAGENKCLFGGQQMRAVQLGADMDAQIQRAHSRENALVLGHRHGKVTAQADQGFCLPGDHGLRGLHRIMPVFRRRRKTEDLFNPRQKGGGGLFGDAHRPVALHV
ncbi:hypothetical protein D3C80_1416010 [compost metagenome]